jgi:hypothetical protein
LQRQQLCPLRFSLGLPTPQDVSKALSCAVLPVIMPVTTVLGAGAGCLIGRHYENKHARQENE